MIKTGRLGPVFLIPPSGPKQASNLLFVTFLIPVSAILLGIGFLGEVLLGQHMIGMVVIGLGLLVIDGRLLPKLQT